MYSLSYFNDRVSTENSEWIKNNQKLLNTVKKFKTETTDYQVVLSEFPQNISIQFFM
jgi:hypothetical protein